MNKAEKNQEYIPNADVAPEQVGEGLCRKVLAHCNELMCVENHFEAGAVGALHSHPHTQITYVAAGVFDFTIEDRTYTVRRGDTLLKQDGVVHGCKCMEAGILVDIFTPMREDFVR